MLNGNISLFSAPCAVRNAFTVDVEDWYHVCGLDAEPLIPSCRRRVVQNVERVLSLLADCGATATFFVLGSVAEQEPRLVPMIAAAGHEIASHGYSHRMVTELGPGLFRDEVRRTGEILERQGGRRPVGFRAPRWSISAATTPWALTILREEGYLYDSSCNPLPFVGERQGRRIPFPVETPAGPILEIPPMVTPSPLGNLPTGGGWGFRFFPRALIGWTAARLNAAGNPAVIYLHPREMEARGPRLGLSPFRGFIVYGPRSSAEGRLKYLLRRFAFGTLRQVAEQWQPA
ncbi:MAG TPA: polysaccharide deacetylase family protein [Geobacteraceae bacterium]